MLHVPTIHELSLSDMPGIIEKGPEQLPAQFHLHQLSDTPKPFLAEFKSKTNLNCFILQMNAKVTDVSK